jgi:hypothetical protein
VEINTHIERRDRVSFSLSQLLHRPGTRYACLAWAGLPPLGLAAALFALLAHYLPGPVRFSSTFLPGLLILPLYIALFFEVKKRRLDQDLSRRLEAGGRRWLLGEFRVLLSEDGVEVSFDSETLHYSWQQVSRVMANSEYGYIYTGPDQAIIIPRKDFPEPEGFRTFMKIAIIYHWNKQQVSSPEPEVPVSRAVVWQEKKLEPLPLSPA